jgi:hypothetical protein
VALFARSGAASSGVAVSDSRRRRLSGGPARVCPTRDLFPV